MGHTGKEKIPVGESGSSSGETLESQGLGPGGWSAPKLFSVPT